MTDADLSRLTIARDDKRGTENIPRRRIPFKPAIVVIIVLAVTTYLLRDKLPSSTLTVELATVTTAYPSQQYTLLNATGYVVAQRKAAVASKATGRLEWLGVTEGSVVKKGEVIARLENGDVAANLQQAGANLRSMQARLQEAEAQQGVAAARGQEVAAELRDAEAALKRAVELAEKGFVAHAATDSALARRDKALAALASAKAAAASARAGIANAQANIAGATAARQGSAVAVEYTLIRAPFDGVVLSKSANVGDVVTPFSSALDAKGAVVAMADMSTLEVEADVAESNLFQVRSGQPCEIQLDALPDTRLRGEVSRIVPTVDRSKATVLVKVRFLDLDNRILPDMSAKVAFLSQEIPAERHKPVTAVRPEAIVTRQGTTLAYVVSAGVAHATTVELGPSLGDLVEIRSGPKSGDRVVINPPQDFKDGSKVRPAAD